jgi:HlyD family secretion protein
MQNTAMPSKPDIAQTLGVDNSQGGVGKFKRWAVGVMLILMAGTGAYFWFHHSTANMPQYKTQAAIRGDLTVTVSATGNLAPTGQVDVGSELSGIITRVTVDFNGRVTKGQPLAYLDDTRFVAAVRGSKAALAAAKARMDQANATVVQRQQNLNRLRQAGTLSAGKALSPFDLESAQADYDRAQADLASARAAILQAEANLQVDETNLSKTVIVSPINGTVLQRQVDPGQTVAASLQAPVLFTLAEDLTRMELQVDVDEADVGQVREGQAATFTVDAYPDRYFRAHITQVRFGASTIHSTQSAGVVTYKTLLAVDNSDLVLRPGMTATADIIVQELQDALLVPNAALRFSPPMQAASTQRRGLIATLMPGPLRRASQQRPASAGKSQPSRVWVLQQGQPAPITVATGMTDGTRTVITQGDLQAGTALVVDMLAVKP